jgi:hypothetical protein
MYYTGLTTKAGPEARPDRRAANLGGLLGEPVGQPGLTEMCRLHSLPLDSGLRGAVRVTTVESAKQAEGQPMVWIPTIRSLFDALDALGASPFRLLTAPDGRDFSPPGGVLQIYDPRAPEPTWPHGRVLLAVDIAPSSAEAREMIRKGARWGCMIIKSYGEPVTDLVMAAKSAGIMLVEADERLTWYQIEELLNAIYTVVRSKQWGIDSS